MQKRPDPEQPDPNDPNRPPNEPSSVPPEQDPPQTGDGSDCEPIGDCLSPSSEGAENRIFFRRPHRIGKLAGIGADARASDPLVTPVPSVSCVPVRRGSLILVADLNIVQHWCLEDLVLDDLSSSFGLAPGETYEFSVKKTQRTRIEKNTLQSSESVESYESSIVDKEVMNVTRNSAKSLNWEASANGSIRLGVFRAGGSASVSGSTKKSAETALEQLEERTEQSSRELKLLNKLEVSRSRETVFESEEVRTVTNPYDDRPLQLNFYEISKSYHVTNRLDPARPFDYAVILAVEDLELDREFVFNQRGFLEESILDRTLWNELEDALREGTARPASDMYRFARSALRYLFEAHDTRVVELEGYGPTEVVGVFDVNEKKSFSKEEWNDPGLSFRHDADKDGFDRARNNQFSDGFGALAVYYQLYLDEYGGDVAPADRDPDLIDGERAVKIALTLADYIGPLWKRLPNGKKKSLFANSKHTEVVRRIPGFLALVDGGVRPESSSPGAPSSTGGDGAEGGEEEEGGPSEATAAATRRDEARQVNDRLDAILQRTVEHIRCNRNYYVKEFLDYIHGATSGYAMAGAFSEVEEWAAGASDALADLLGAVDPTEGFQDGFHYVLPVRRDVERDKVESMISAVLGDSLEDPEIEDFVGDVAATEADVLLPADGYHLEAVAGSGDCMPDVPEDGESVSASFDVEATG